ncbi:hypothetical protein GLP37_21580 [Photobacterium phosphoreum]|uniref:hypothetical protein n=1 Tax=Photobacterium phosphoreum TaxID=659 RepID=UPI001E2A572E|nr:hypothetical protein [Photobacterium phosphoreum]MCD9504757.1 hypothetical protein [Photobacterium phosphoreum]
MGLDPRGFMDGAFRGFQMMESHYDRQDRKQERTDGLRRADEVNTENQRRYDAQIARQDERQTVEDQRYTENRIREDKNLTEEKVWRKQVHEDNKALQSLRYATSGQPSSREYRSAVTKLRNWKHDAIGKIDPLMEGKERELAIESINSQYDARLTDFNSLYVTPEPTPKGGDNGIGKSTPPPNPVKEAPYLSWANNKDKANFVNLMIDKGQDLSAATPEMLDTAFKSVIETKKTNQFNTDAESLRQKFYKTQ